MSKRIRMVLAAVGVLRCFVDWFGFRPNQRQQDGRQKHAGKMTSQQMMDKMDKMSVDEKAGMFDR